MAVLIDGRGDSLPSQDHIQEFQIADGILLGPEQSSQDGPGRIVCSMEKARGRPLGTEPEMRTAVPLHEKSDLRSSCAGCGAGRPTTPFRPDPRLPQPATDRLPPDPKTLPLLQHLDEVGIVELGIDLPVEGDDPFADFRTQGVWGNLAPAPMGQSPLGLLSDIGPPGASLDDSRPS